eukprot:jgi/Botrbrau1/9943/Bobra.0012s0040.1
MSTFRPHEPLVQFLSHDMVGPDDDPDAWPIDFLNAQEMSGLPPHKLELKVGCPIILMRNMTSGLANGTRCICKGFGRKHLYVEVATGPLQGKKLYLPRVKLNPSDTRWPFTLYRKQFPIKPAFAMTINKSQGQSLSMVGVYLAKPVFCHGQLYVGNSRVGDPAALKIMVVDGPDNAHVLDNGVHKAYTKNVVCREVIS